MPVLVSALVERDDSGVPRLHHVVFFRAKGRREYERELLLARRRAERERQAKADFIAMVSHEIRNPLGAIIGVTHLLESAVSPAEQAHYIDVLKSSSERLLGLVNDVLDFSKIDAGKVQLEDRTFDLANLVQGVGEGFRLKAEQKGVALRLDLDPALPSALRGDPVKLGQVLTNLLGNALKFTAHGAVVVSVEVTARGPDEVGVAFSVADTGIGIPPERLEAIFDEFTQASSDINARFGGTGLGLPISRRLLRLFGSELVVASTPGEGSVFSFSLRLRTVAEAPPARPPTPSDEQALRGVRVLVAEDSQVNAFVLGSFLRQWGCLFDVVENGAAAVERARLGDYDLLLLDRNMPGLDGLTAAQQIRALSGERFARLPIIALSASVASEPNAGDGTSPFDDAVAKPFAPHDLFQRLVHHVRRGAERRESGASATAPPWGPPPFDLAGLAEEVVDDPAALRQLCLLVEGDLRSCRETLPQALLSGDQQTYEERVHKSRAVFDLLRANGVKEAVAQGTELLAATLPLPAACAPAAALLAAELDALIGAVARWGPAGEAGPSEATGSR